MFRPIDFTKDSFLADYSGVTTIYYGFYTVDQPLTSGGVVDQTKAQFLIVRQIVDGSGNTTSFKWASNKYDQIYADRATLTYV